MRFVIARFQHETNSFCPLRTTLEAFKGEWGEKAYLAQKGVGTAMGAFISFAEEEKAEFSTPFAGFANPSGIVEADAYEKVCERIIQDVKKGCDAILLDLHGAMVAEGAPDGEGELLQRIRAVAPTTPLVVALDLHANVTKKMVDNCDIMVSLKTYPHVDMYETGEHICRLLKQYLEDGIKPVMAYCQLPLVSHTMRSNTNEGAMKLLVDKAKELEKDPSVQAVSIVAGFTLSDFYDAGMTVIVVTDGKPDLADAIIDDLRVQIWNRKEDFVYHSSPLSDSLDEALNVFSKRENDSCPVLLVDHSDNVMSGGMSDTMDVMEAMLSHPGSFKGVVVGPIWDPQTVEQLERIPIGQRTTIKLGNKSGWLYNGVPKEPLTLEGEVKNIVDGEFQVKGPIFTRQVVTMGRTALFKTENDIEIIISSDRMEPYDIQVMTLPGVDISKKNFVLLKSRIYCRPEFGPLCSGFVLCDSDDGGPTSSNYAFFNFKNIRKEVYPLNFTDKLK